MHKYGIMIEVSSLWTSLQAETLCSLKKEKAIRQSSQNFFNEITHETT